MSIWSTISPVTAALGKGTGKFINSYASSKAFTNYFEKGAKNPAKIAADLMVFSLVSKDAVNCAIYTYQSANNPKIPKERRSFVSALDFTNGIINVVGQIGSYILVENTLTPWLKAKLFTGVVVNPKTKEKNYTYTESPYSKDSVHKTVAGVFEEKMDKFKKAGFSREESLKHFEEISKKAVKRLTIGGKFADGICTGLGLIVALLATNALIKRTVTPMLATPLADKCKGWFDTSKSQDKSTQLTPAEIDSTMPEHKTTEKKARTEKV